MGREALILAFKNLNGETSDETILACLNVCRHRAAQYRLHRNNDNNKRAVCSNEDCDARSAYACRIGRSAGYRARKLR